MKRIITSLAIAIVVIALAQPGGLDIKAHITGERILESIGIGAVLFAAVFIGAIPEIKKFLKNDDN